jgi:hypothetical protein
MDIDHQYSERVEAVLGRSARAEGFVAAGSLATAALLAALPIEVELRAAGLAWIAGSALRALHRLRPGVRMRAARDGAIEVGTRSGAVRPGSFVAPWLVIVRWRPSGEWWDSSLAVAPDMLGAEDFRRLRVLLRFGDRPLGPLSRGPKPTKGTDLGMDDAA